MPSPTLLENIVLNMQRFEIAAIAACRDAALGRLELWLLQLNQQVFLQLAAKAALLLMTIIQIIVIF